MTTSVCFECHWSTHSLCPHVPCRPESCSPTKLANHYELPPGVRYHDYWLRRYEAPVANEGTTQRRDPYVRRVDRLHRQNLCASARVEHENDVLAKDNGGSYPVYLHYEHDYISERNFPSSNVKPSVQMQHTFQLEMLMSQLMSGHDWGGVANVLATLCSQYRELPFASFKPVSVFS